MMEGEATSLTSPYQPGPMAIDCTTDKDGGVLKEILRESVDSSGAGPQNGDTVFVHYVGTLAENGSKFDSSRDRDEQFSFTLGQGQVIKGWDCSVATMKKGELARVTCKSEYAYGAAGSPPKIPPNSTLVFEIELFTWYGDDLSSLKDGGITRKTIIAGSGYLTPNEGAMVDISLIGRVEGKVFDERELQFYLGEGEDANVPDGLETALKQFKKDEKSVITLAPQYCFGSKGNPSLGLPPDLKVEYEITLKNFEKSKEPWNMEESEKVEQAKVLKERGTKYFKEGNYPSSVKQYKKVVEFLQFDTGLEKEKEEGRSLLLASHLNLSMCYLKLNDNLNAREHATKAIDIDSRSVKGYFRRGQALMNLNEPIEAAMDYKKVLELDKTNKVAAQQLQKCQITLKAIKDKEKKLYGGMFDKFAKMDSMNTRMNSDKKAPQCAETLPES